MARLGSAGVAGCDAKVPAPPRRYSSVGLIAYAVSLLGGCNEWGDPLGTTVRPEQWRVVLELPNEDIRAADLTPAGTLIVLTEKRIVRVGLSGPGESVSAPTDVDAKNAIHALTNDSVVVLGRECGSVFLMRALVAHYQERPAELVRGYPEPPCVHFYSVDADAQKNIWVVGSQATILHYDGSQWRLEDNPLQALVGDRSSAVFGTYFWSVSASRGEAVIAAMRRLLVRRNGTWDTLPPLNSSMPRWCGFRTASFLDGTIVAGGGTPACLARFGERGWTDESAKVRSFRDMIARGQAVGDTAALMWSPLGDVVLITRDDTRVYHAPAIQPFVSAHLVNDSLLLVGQHGEAGVVVKIPLDE